MEKRRLGTSLRRWRTRVDLPDPEGAEMMKTVLKMSGSHLTRRRGDTEKTENKTPRLRASASKRRFSFSFQVQTLFTNFIDLTLRGKSQVRNRQTQISQPARLRQDRVALPIHLLQQEIQLLSDLARGIEHRLQLSGVRAQTHQLFGDIAAVGEQRRFLRQTLGVDGGAVQQVCKLLAKPLLECRHRAGANFVHARDQPGDRVATLPQLLRGGCA